MTSVRVGIVVPTLGTRPDYLQKSLQSIRNSGHAHICVVCPALIDLSKYVSEGLIDSRVDDPGLGLSQAINVGINSLPSEISMVSWLGDDDLLESGMLRKTAELLSKSKINFVWGQCRYIDSEDKPLFLNRSGRWAKYLIRFGPNLIPQPGSLFSRASFDELGGLSKEFSWAFDQDFFTRLLRKKSSTYIPEVVSSFRWHEGSLSAGARAGSVRESSIIRVRYMPSFVRPFSKIWEPIVRGLIMYSGRWVSKISK